MAEYRIEYTIQRMDEEVGEADFTDVGFGSSGGWSNVDSALHALASDVGNANWETEKGMPDPDEIWKDGR